ncbi:hypothetical protein DXG03_001271 [Asterophora parasitica]|uniref:Uncharacterized protein n=1 Tax=Asterophora parasitica TaxID=117018 RepID=A0A9P7KCX4_9AGAR|nr:hypothetical protein DXG03_001271 [Asterophora parasitica]
MSSFVAFRTAALSLGRTGHLPTRRQPTTCLQPFMTRGAKKVAKTLPRDEAIEHSVVQIVDAETGKLTEPTPLRTILASIDRRKEFVELVSVRPSPLVKILSRSEAMQREQEAAQKARVTARKNIHKEVQLTWSAAPGDLAHKLEKIRLELERGARVDLMFTRRKDQAHLPLPEVQARVQEIVDGLADVSKEWKDREVKASMAAIFLQGLNEPVPVGRTKVVLHRGPKAKKPKVDSPRQKQEQVVVDIYQD